MLIIKFQNPTFSSAKWRGHGFNGIFKDRLKSGRPKWSVHFGLYQTVGNLVLIDPIRNPIPTHWLKYPKPNQIVTYVPKQSEKSVRERESERTAMDPQQQRAGAPQTRPQPPIQGGGGDSSAILFVMIAFIAIFAMVTPFIAIFCRLLLLYCI